MISNSTQQILNKVAKELGLPKEVAFVAYRSYWLFIKDTIKDLPDLLTISEEDFDKLRVNFNIVEFGKLTTNYNKVLKTRRFKEIVTQLKQNKLNEANQFKEDSTSS